MSTKQPEHPRGSNVFAFTCTYHDRRLSDTVRRMRASAGMWFDWGAWSGAPTEEAYDDLRELLYRPDNAGIQYLKTWPQNRGQHHAMAEALAHARGRGYTWFLRLDDDIRPKSKRWLKNMLERLQALKEASKDSRDRIVCAPRILGLRNPLKPIGPLDMPGITFPADAMPILGGACRLHPLGLLDDYPTPLLAPKGRRDPEEMASWVIEDKKGLLVRFPDIRIVHDTNKLEGQESEEQQLTRKMGHIWPYLGPLEAA